MFLPRLMGLNVSHRHSPRFDAHSASALGFIISHSEKRATIDCGFFEGEGFPGEQCQGRWGWPVELWTWNRPSEMSMIKTNLKWVQIHFSIWVVILFHYLFIINLIERCIVSAPTLLAGGIEVEEYLRCEWYCAPICWRKCTAKHLCMIDTCILEHLKRKEMNSRFKSSRKKRETLWWYMSLRLVVK